MYSQVDYFTNSIYDKELVFGIHYISLWKTILIFHNLISQNTILLIHELSVLIPIVFSKQFTINLCLNLSTKI